MASVLAAGAIFPLVIKFASSDATAVTVDTPAPPAKWSVAMPGHDADGIGEGTRSERRDLTGSPDQCRSHSGARDDRHPQPMTSLGRKRSAAPGQY